MTAGPSVVAVEEDPTTLPTSVALERAIAFDLTPYPLGSRARILLQERLDQVRFLQHQASTAEVSELQARVRRLEDEVTYALRKGQEMGERAVRTEVAADLAQLPRLRALEAALRAPETEDFDRGVPLEATHARERWAAQDAEKTALDWFRLVLWLMGKSFTAYLAGQRAKARHHAISTAAACRNYFAWVQAEEQLHAERVRADLSELQAGLQHVAGAAGAVPELPGADREPV